MVAIAGVGSFASLLWLAQPSACSGSAECVKLLAPSVQFDAVAADRSDLAATYSRGGGLSGSELYLFTDGTYIHCEWADILPLTVSDKGRWTVIAGMVVFESDAEVTWSPTNDHEYLPVRLRSRPRDLLLVGVQQDLALFQQMRRRSEFLRYQPEDVLRGVAFSRKQLWKPGEESKQKKRLLEQAWHPEHFAPRKEGGPSNDEIQRTKPAEMKRRR